jgi:hypothetical protein
MRGRDALQRAEYYLFAWQVREIQRLARQSGRHPSEVVRQLLTQALASGASQAADASPPHPPSPTSPSSPSDGPVG